MSVFFFSFFKSSRTMFLIEFYTNEKSIQNATIDLFFCFLELIGVFILVYDPLKMLQPRRDGSEQAPLRTKPRLTVLSADGDQKSESNYGQISVSLNRYLFIFIIHDYFIIFISLINFSLSYSHRFGFCFCFFVCARVT